MQKFKVTLLATALFATGSCFAAGNNAVLTYSNTNFSNPQVGWSNDTLTITNNSSQPIVITNMQFETNYKDLPLNEIYGTIFHPASATVTKLADFDYQYSFSTISPGTKGTIIPAKGSVNLTQIPMVHDAVSKNGIPEYHQPPFNIKVTTLDGSVISPALEGKCEGDACKDSAPGKLVSAYFTNWANYRYSNNPRNMLMPDQIPLKYINAIYYDVGKINRVTAEVSFSDINHDQNYIPAFATLKQQYPYLNLIYSFGGWGDTSSGNYPSYDLATIFDKRDPKLIQTLADNMVNTIRQLGFNGIDIDYEWNAIQPGGKQMDLTPDRAKGFQLLLEDIRKDLDKIQPADNPHYYKLTAAVFAGPDSVQKFVDNGGSWAAVAKAVDYLGVMTYDIHGQFDADLNSPDNITGFLSNMATSHQYKNYPILNKYSVIDGINAYREQGVPIDKLILGIPAYTRIEQTSVPVTKDNKGLYLTLASSNLQPAGEAGGGSTDYKCIVDPKYCWGSFSFGNSLVHVPANLIDATQPGFMEKTPWAYDTTKNWFMSFDDGRSAGYKGAWAKQQGLGGVMIWEIDGDIPLTDANQVEFEKDSVLYNAWQGLVH